MKIKFAITRYNILYIIFHLTTFVNFRCETCHFTERRQIAADGTLNENKEIVHEYQKYK